MKTGFILSNERLLQNIIDHYKIKKFIHIGSWNNIMSYFIFPEIRPLPLPSPSPDSYREKVIGLRVNKVIVQYLFPVT
jgi:hypothetical protein